MNRRSPMQLLRRRSGFETGLEIAQKLRITSFHFSDLEVGRAKPSDELVKRIAKLYSVTQREVHLASQQTRLAFLEQARADLLEEMERSA